MLSNIYKALAFNKSTKISNDELANLRGQIAAIGKSQGVIEFTMDGHVITANDTFLNILGYSPTEAKSQSHSTFVDPVYRASSEYKAFWGKLNFSKAVNLDEFEKLFKHPPLIQKLL